MTRDSLESLQLFQDSGVITRVIKSNDSSIHYLTSGPPAFLFFWTVTHLLSPSLVTVQVTSRPSKVWTTKVTGVLISLFTGSEPGSGIVKRTKIWLPIQIQGQNRNISLGVTSPPFLPYSQNLGPDREAKVLAWKMAWKTALDSLYWKKAQNR